MQNQKPSPDQLSAFLEMMQKVAGTAGQPPATHLRQPTATPALLREWGPRIMRALLSDGPQGEKARAAARLILDGSRELIAAGKELDHP